jgi:hypothetical protein
MSLNSRSIAKILREHFTGETPIVKNAFEQKEFISNLKKELKKIKGIEISDHRYSVSNSKDKFEKQCHFSIEDESQESRFRFYGSDSFTLKFNPVNQLFIEHYGDSRALIYQMEQINSFIERIKEEHQNKKARKTKREKINTLKQQAIIAKIKEIAKEDQFDFCARPYSNKLKIGICIEGGKLMEIDIPYREFQNILKDLRSLIQTVNDLQKSGIGFKLTRDSGYRGYGWITYDRDE